MNRRITNFNQKLTSKRSIDAMESVLINVNKIEDTIVENHFFNPRILEEK
ncbi:MAG: hypothetical protein N3E39_00340 [Candidatus Methanomethylicia archaeon]|nr:hypothetical protein [Candidatus Methanomethylicia archaeon]